MFTVIDHSNRQTHSAGTLEEARADVQNLPNATVCDEDGVIRATTRGGVYTPCNVHGFPEGASHAA